MSYKASSEPAMLETGSANLKNDKVTFIDHEAERKLVRKYDMIIMPNLCLAYMFNSLDRSNLGNAKTDGMPTDINLMGNQYSIIVGSLYATWCGFCLPWNWITRKITPRVSLSLMMFCRGICGLCLGFVKNFSQLLALRLLLGFFEAGFSAGTIFYFSSFFKRSELAIRIAWFYAASTIAGAFSGLISYRVFNIHKPENPIYGWQALFFIEGSLTILVSLPGYFLLPASMKTCWWLNNDEKQLAVNRMLSDGSVQVASEFSLRDAIQPFKDWKLYVWALTALSYGVPSATSNFLPQIVARLNATTVITNLLTVAPNLWGALMILIIAYSSDRNRERTGHLMFCYSCSLVGYVLLYTVSPSNKAVLYFATFVLTTGCYTPSVILHSWHLNNKLAENHRATNSGFLTMFANSAGLISSYTFFANQAPKYQTNLIVTFAFASVSIILTLGMRLWMMRENRRRDKLEGFVRKSQDVDTTLLVEGTKDIRWSTYRSRSHRSRSLYCSNGSEPSARA